MEILKRCNKTGCRELISVSDRYCDKHKGNEYREYNKRRRETDREYV